MGPVVTGLGEVYIWTLEFKGPAARTGNVAFDDWREKELARLDEERQKLMRASEEFEAYARELRRAKDSEEFERFMASRRNGASPTTINL